MTIIKDIVFKFAIFKFTFFKFTFFKVAICFSVAFLGAANPLLAQEAKPIDPKEKEGVLEKIQQRLEIYTKNPAGKIIDDSSLKKAKPTNIEEITGNIAETNAVEIINDEFNDVNSAAAIAEEINQQEQQEFSIFPTEEEVSTSNAIDQIQKTLLFSNKKKVNKESTKKEPSPKIDYSDKSPSKVEISIIDSAAKSNKGLNQKLTMAYNASITGQYEVAVELYKQILESQPNNHYASFALAASYHKLGQYKQAKKLYYELLKYEWADEESKNELIGNLIEVLVEESPNDAIYVLDKLSSENPNSAYIIAGTAMAYDKIDKPSQAILLLKRAIYIDPIEVRYKFNLAIIYDKIGDYPNAINYYQKVLRNYVLSDKLDNSLPIQQIEQRVEFIKRKI
ncbi:MAG: tetratricopeptide (TPR) repeat protein [Rickettsiales bacterium]|jgi:tetratricopeptide (TPR) repeat protein